ncbi:B-cell receptor CD22-like isoform X1 [Nerophis lumbriciformis]|uniref:B-cell receptor CD22-like isoform X1 n=2 Tax=Nerophis lumbriciformis TaxID=546530 RepID=UPI002AE089EF|nr:B-cell receptor CD22-like isoform X1 [Nerophis lumbriciformis]
MLSAKQGGEKNKMLDVVASIFLLCCLFEGSQCNVWKLIVPSHVETLSGTCVRIPCKFTAPDNWVAYIDDSCRVKWRTYKWYKGYTEVFDSRAKTYSNRRPGTFIGNLKNLDCTTIWFDIPSVLPDNVFYFLLECKRFQQKFDQSLTLDVRAAPRGPTLKANSVYLKEGDALTLACEAITYCPTHPPELTWQPSLSDSDIKVTLKDTTRISVMKANASSRHNAVKVTCKTNYGRKNKANDGSEYSLTLHVDYAPKNTSVGYVSPVTEGTSITMTCITNANPVVDSYTWYQVDGDQVTPVGSSTKMSITVTEATNTFYCRVHNRYGYQNSSITVIDVQFPPKETTVILEPAGPIVEGDTVVLLCQNRAQPPVSNYVWFKDDGKEDNETGADLHLERVETKHSGGYRCQATNKLGEETSATVQLDVEYPPRNTSVAVYPSGPVTDGSAVTLRCTSVANPAVANFTWYRVAAGEREVMGQGEVISFNVSKRSQEDFYCQTVNVHGLDVSEPLNINVTFRPEILASSHCEDVSSQTRCSCDSRANPPPLLRWELSGVPVNQSAITDVTTPLLRWELSGVPVNQSAITNVTLGGVTRTSVVTLKLPDQDRDALSLVCFSVNPLGLDSLAFNMSSPRMENARYSLWVLVGSPVGVLAMLFLSLLLILHICRKTKGRYVTNPGQEDDDTAPIIATNEEKERDSGYVNVVFNKQADIEEDQVDFADVNVVKFEAKNQKTKGRYTKNPGQDDDDAVSIIATNEEKESNSGYVNIVFNNQADVEEDQLDIAEVNVVKFEAKNQKTKGRYTTNPGQDDDDTVPIIATNEEKESNSGYVNVVFKQPGGCRGGPA